MNDTPQQAQAHVMGPAPTEMTLPEYQQLAVRTAKFMPTFEKDMIHTALGLGSETGELAELYAREAAGLNNQEDVGFFRKHLIEEIGDLLWYNAYGQYCINSIWPNMIPTAEWEGFQTDTFRTLSGLTLTPKLHNRSILDSLAAFLSVDPPPHTVLDLINVHDAAVGDFLTLLKVRVVYDNYPTKPEKQVTPAKLRAALQTHLSCLLEVILAMGLTFDEVATANISKLRARYPDSYTDEWAATRLDKKEGE